MKAGSDFVQPVDINIKAYICRGEFVKVKLVWVGLIAGLILLLSMGSILLILKFFQLLNQQVEAVEAKIGFKVNVKPILSSALTLLIIIILLVATLGLVEALQFPSYICRLGGMKGDE